MKTFSERVRGRVVTSRTEFGKILTDMGTANVKASTVTLIVNVRAGKLKDLTFRAKKCRADVLPVEFAYIEPNGDISAQPSAVQFTCHRADAEFLLGSDEILRDANGDAQASFAISANVPAPYRMPVPCNHSPMAEVTKTRNRAARRALVRNAVYFGLTESAFHVAGFADFSQRFARQFILNIETLYDATQVA